MNKPFSPDISRYRQLLPYFQDFYTLNKEKNKNFSYQYLANKLNWSAPYLNDVFKGRKRLSMNRALEFIEFLELKNLAAERFLILYLADSDTAFAHSKIKEDSLSSRDATLKPSTFTLDEVVAQFETLFEYYISMYIHYNKGVWDTQKFLNQVTLTQKPPAEKIEAILAKLIKQNRLKYNPKTALYKVLHQDHDLLHVDQKAQDPEAIRKEITRSSQECAAYFLDYLKNPIAGKSTYFHGIVSLNKDQYIDVRTRFLAFHNYVMGLSEKAQELYDKNPDTEAGAEGRVWQYQMNIFSIFENKN